MLIRVAMSAKPEDQGEVWNDDAFRAHAQALADGQRRSLWEVCKTAGLAADYLTKTTYSGRNIRALLALSKSLKVDVSELVQAGQGKVVDSDSLRRMALASHIAAHLYVAMNNEASKDAAEAERIAKVIMGLMRRGKEQPQSQ